MAILTPTDSAISVNEPASVHYLDGNRRYAYPHKHESSRVGYTTWRANISEEHSDYIIDIKRPTREEYVACLVITPKHRDGHTDVSAKVERNLGRDKCVKIAHELLAACGASEALLAQVQELAPDLKHPITA